MIRSQQSRRASFTLVELLVVTALIMILATTALFALYGAMEQARQARTRAQIVKINELIMPIWESFGSRRIALPMDPSWEIRYRATARLLAIRQIMRMELPDRITDVYDDTQPFDLDGDGQFDVPPLPRTTLSRSYVRRVRSIVGENWYLDPQPVSPLIQPNYWTFQQQGSECLYMILASIRDEDTTGIDFFKPQEIGDTDADGMPEILDAWGRPIKFLRWAPGFVTNPGPDGFWGRGGDSYSERGWPGRDDRSELQSRDARESPDPFDPLRVDLRWETPDLRFDPNEEFLEFPFALYPLVYSNGPDGLDGIRPGDIEKDDQQLLFHYSTTVFAGKRWPNDPFHTPDQIDTRVGHPTPGSEDNITNHLLVEN